MSFKESKVAKKKTINFSRFLSQDGAFYRAVLCVHKQDYEMAHQLIDLTRDMLDTELTALSAESYQRAYPIMIQVSDINCPMRVTNKFFF